MILMFYYRRASPKRCNDTTEVEYGGGGHRTRLRNDLKDQLVCLWGAPLPPYIKEQGGGRPALEGRAKGGGVLLPVGVGLPFPSPTRFGEGEGKERERERERGAAPPPPCPIRTPHGGGAPPPGAALSLPSWPIMAHYFPGGSGNPFRHSGIIRNHSEPFRCPNIAVQYINLYVSTISTLLVMSVISSGTPNSFGTSKYTNS